jgi:hypothetical protein
LQKGSESWTIRETDINRVKSVEMRYLRNFKGCTRLDHIENEDIRRELATLKGPQ